MSGTFSAVTLYKREFKQRLNVRKSVNYSWTTFKCRCVLHKNTIPRLLTFRTNMRMGKHHNGELRVRLFYWSMCPGSPYTARWTKGGVEGGSSVIREGGPCPRQSWLVVREPKTKFKQLNLSCTSLSLAPSLSLSHIQVPHPHLAVFLFLFVFMSEGLWKDPGRLHKGSFVTFLSSSR